MKKYRQLPDKSMKPKIYLAHSSKYDFQRELYQPIKNSGLHEKYDFTYLLDQPGNLPNTKELIQSIQQ